jgi:hypothetical protein
LTQRLGQQPLNDWVAGASTAILAAMSAIQLRVRFVSGDLTDVTYESVDEGEQERLLEQVVSTLGQDTGALWCQHGDRVLVLFGRGIAALEVSPRGAVL